MKLEIIGINTPIGMLEAVLSARGLQRLHFLSQTPSEQQEKEAGISDRAELLIKCLERYFRASKKDLENGYFKDLASVSLDPQGSEFQKAAWAFLQGIPFGETRSYSEQARAMGHPRAARAVANANAQNPIAILIPCHRVIAQNGSLSGYNGGKWRKKFLLEHEAKAVSRPETGRGTVFFEPVSVVCR